MERQNYLVHQRIKRYRSWCDRDWIFGWASARPPFGIVSWLSVCPHRQWSIRLLFLSNGQKYFPKCLDSNQASAERHDPVPERCRRSVEAWFQFESPKLCCPTKNNRLKSNFRQFPWGLEFTGGGVLAAGAPEPPPPPNRFPLPVNVVGMIFCWTTLSSFSTSAPTNWRSFCLWRFL